MTAHAPITPTGALTPHLPYNPTPIAVAFSALMVALPVHIEAEREIEDVDVWDPAFSNWLTDAEHAFEAVTTQLSTIASLEVMRPEDMPLKRISLLIDAMIGSEDPDGFRSFYVLLPKFEALFWRSGSSDAAQHANEMLEAARAHIDTLATLLTYDDLAETDVDEAVEPLNF